MTDARLQDIKRLLHEALGPEHLSVEDRSAQHAGHAGAQESGGGHYCVLVVSAKFVGCHLVARHRMVYQAVASLREQIHALAITAQTPDEWAASSS